MCDWSSIFSSTFDWLDDTVGYIGDFFGDTGEWIEDKVSDAFDDTINKWYDDFEDSFKEDFFPEVYQPPAPAIPGEAAPTASAQRLTADAIRRSAESASGGTNSLRIPLNRNIGGY